MPGNSLIRLGGTICHVSAPELQRGAEMCGCGVARGEEIQRQNLLSIYRLYCSKTIHEKGYKIQKGCLRIGFLFPDRYGGHIHNGHVATCHKCSCATTRGLGPKTMQHYGNSVSLFVGKSFPGTAAGGWLRCVGLPPVGASRHDAAGGCCSDAVGPWLPDHSRSRKRC